VKQNLLQYAQLAAVVVVVVGCFQILQPFIPAILFAAVACSSSWPLFKRLRRAVGERSSLAAALMTLGLVVLVIGPTAGLAFSLADDVTGAVHTIKELLDRGPLMPPEWLRGLPLVGEALDGYWHRMMGSREEFTGLLKSLIEPARSVLVVASKAIGSGLVQMVFAMFISFFFFRDGELLVQAVRRILARLAGELGHELLATTDSTVTGVVQGIFGTALAQALVALLGFLIAGVPGALALATATFFLSLIPVGPPLIWGGATLWLFYQGSLGWAVFMALWGLLVISSIDNIVKPYLISRSSSLPLLLIVFGVFGGIIAFGFIGVFIGPPMLAVGLTLVHLWTVHTPKNAAQSSAKTSA